MLELLDHCPDGLQVGQSKNVFILLPTELNNRWKLKIEKFSHYGHYYFIIIIIDFIKIVDGLL